MFREVLDTKQTDIQENQARVTELKEKYKENSIQLQTQKLALSGIANKEWYKLLEDLKGNHKSLTRSMIIKNKVMYIQNNVN